MPTVTKLKIEGMRVVGKLELDLDGPVVLIGVNAAARPNDRDKVLSAAADAPAKSTRDEIREMVPSFDRLVRRLAVAYRCLTGP